VLPSKLLRFPDLKCVGINNWPTLKRRVQEDGFPAGRYVGRNTRVWTAEEVEAWFNSRPQAKVDPPPNVVKPAPLLETRGTGQTKTKKHPGYNNESEPSQPSLKKAG
jgi:hypothetical protein